MMLLRKLELRERRIRNNSDYDDFYIADKQECNNQVATAEEFLKKAEEFLNIK